MKKTLVFLLAGVLATGIFLSTGLESKTVQASTIQKNEVEKSTRTVINLTREEYIQKISEIEGVSIEDARDRINEREIKQGLTKVNSVNGGISTYAISTYYQQIYSTETLGDCELTYGFLATISSSGSFRWFSNTDSPYVLPTGISGLSWTGGNAVAKISSNSNAVSFFASGTIDGTISSSYEAGFEAAGFSVSTSTSNTIYVRKFHQISKTFSIY